MESKRPVLRAESLIGKGEKSQGEQEGRVAGGEGLDGGKKHPLPKLILRNKPFCGFESIL